MRICFITPEFPTEEYFSGGISQVVYRKAKWLAKAGNDVHVIAHSNRIEDFEKENIHIHLLSFNENNFFFKMVNLATFNRLTGILYWFFFSVKAWLLLKRLSKDADFDVVDSSNYKACGFFAMLFLKTPVHLLFAASYRPAWDRNIGLSRNINVKMLENLEALYYRLSKNVYSPSEYLKDMLIKELGLENVEVIRIPFHREVLTQDNTLYEEYLKGKPYLLFFGKLQLHKGPHILAQALPGFLLKFSDAYAAFVGPDAAMKDGGSTREYIVKTNKQFKDRLIFLDQLSHDKLYPIISGARLVVLPSLIDNLPNALLEAMGLGKPVIGTIGCSFDEVIEDGKNGFLVVPGNAQALTKKLCEAWVHPVLEKIGAAAKEKIKEFAPQYTIGMLVDYYKMAISKNRH